MRREREEIAEDRRKMNRKNAAVLGSVKLDGQSAPGILSPPFFLLFPILLVPFVDFLDLLFHHLDFFLGEPHFLGQLRSAKLARLTFARVDFPLAGGTLVFPRLRLQCAHKLNATRSPLLFRQ